MTALVSDIAVWLSRSPELSMVVKTSAVLAFGLLIARLIRRGRASTRHLVLAASFGVVLLLPVSAAVAPRLRVYAPVSLPNAIPDSSLENHAASTPRLATSAVAFVRPNAPTQVADAWTLVVAAWAAGVLAMLTSLAIALLRLGQIRRQGPPCRSIIPLAHRLATEAGIRRVVEVMTHECVSSPLTCGVFRTTILLPRDAVAWSAADIQRALVHELEHARRNDWPVHLVVHAVRALHWFNPLAWTASRRLQLEAERACDDAVVKTAERTDYADQLVALAERLSTGEAAMTLGMARRSDLAARVSALLDSRQPRGRAGVPATIGAMAVSLSILAAVGPMVVVAASDGGRQTSTPRARGTSADRALYRAAERGDVDRITELLAAGANINAVLEGDGSPLIAAARAGRLAAVRLLLDGGADPNLGVEGDGNPLIMAAREGHGAIVALLLDRGASIELVVPGDENSLIQASGHGHLAVVKLLVSRGANVNARVWVESGSGVVGGVPGGVVGGVAGGVPGGVPGGVVGGASGEWRSPLSMARAGGHADVVAYLQSAGARE